MSGNWRAVCWLLALLAVVGLPLRATAAGSSAGSVGITFIAPSSPPPGVKPPTGDGNVIGGEPRPDRDTHVTILDQKTPAEDILGTLPKTGGGLRLPIVLILAGAGFLRLSLRGAARAPRFE